jgi:S-adenosylmethionine hydrolase
VFITFLSDFGLQDDFVGTCHGVIARIAPQAPIIDITHGIEPQAVLQGALVLANTIPYMPEGVHLAVVDPGVGTGRRSLAARDAAGRLYIGPDNGLLVPAAEKQGGVRDAWELANPAYMLEPVSRTFHGRDVFAPAAAQLAVGLDPADLGPPVEPGSLVRLELPAPDIGESRIVATVLYVDRYGNVQLNLSRSDVEQAGIVPGRRQHVRGCRARRHHPLRGCLPEHRGRDHGRQRSAGVRDPPRATARRRPRELTLTWPLTAAVHRLGSRPEDVRGTVAPARTSFFVVLAAQSRRAGGTTVSLG